MSVRSPRDATALAPAPERRSRLERVLAAGQQSGTAAVAVGAQAKEGEADAVPDTDRELSLLTLARGSRTFENHNPPFTYCVDDDDVWGMCPPPQSPNTTNKDFYGEAFNSADPSRVFGNLREIARVIESGLVLGSSKSAVLRTLPAYHPIATIDWWHALLSSVKFDFGRADTGSFNTVMKLTTAENLGVDYGTWFWAMTQGMLDGKNVPYDMNSTGKVVVRRNTLPKKNDHPDLKEAREKSLAPQNVAREIYLTAYASHYKIGPTLVATWYQRDYVPPAPAIPLDQLVNAPTTETKETLAKRIEEHGKVAMELPRADKTPIARYITVAMAWQGDTSFFLKNLGNAEFDGVRDRMNAVFAYRLVDLFVNAAVVGLFHGDLNAKNVLYRMRADPVTGVPIPNSLMLCLTDFDPQFVVLVPPKERRTCAHCLVVASLCSYLGFVRCAQWYYPPGTWEALKNYVRPILKDVLMGKDVGALEESRKDPLCAFLNDTTTIHQEAFGKPGGRKADLGEGYEGQKRILSANWQHMVMNYMNGMAVLNPNGPGGTERVCIPLDPKKRFYNQVVEYAFGNDGDDRPTPRPETPPPASVRPDVATPVKKKEETKEAKSSPNTKSFSEVDGVAR